MNRESGRMALKFQNCSNVVVTGGAGFIGSHLVDSLSSMGVTTHVFDDFSTGREENLSGLPNQEYIKIHEMDVRNMTATDIPRDTYAIYHQAALPSVDRSVEYPHLITSVNVDGTVAVLEAAARSDVERVVYASSSSVYGDTEALPKTIGGPLRPQSPYAASKAAGEQYCHAYDQLGDVSVVALRYFNVFGPRQDPDSDYAAVIPTFIDQMLDEDTQEYTVHGDGRQSRDFTHVDNVVQANHKAAVAPDRDLHSHVYNVGCGERYTLQDLMYLIDSFGSGEPMQRNHTAAREGDVRHSMAGIMETKRDLGYKVRTPFAVGVGETFMHTKKERG